MDHEWGPRIFIYLKPEDKNRYGEDIHKVLQRLLPSTCMHIDLMWRKPGVDVHETTEKALYNINVLTVDESLKARIGDKMLPLGDIDWLEVSEQHLLELTAGVVYKDDFGELTRVRDLLNYYPDNVLRFLLMKEWQAIGGDWVPIGRIGPRRDEIGLRIRVTKLVQRLMRIAFKVHRRYFPYKKWFGTMFKKLPIAQELEPPLLGLLEDKNWKKVEEKIGEITGVILDHQNQLKISPPLEHNQEKLISGRHHIKVDFLGIGNQVSHHIKPPLNSLIQNEVFWLDSRNHILWNEEVGKWSLLLQR
jgi:hypothetical protein